MVEVATGGNSGGSSGNSISGGGGGGGGSSSSADEQLPMVVRVCNYVLHYTFFLHCIDFLFGYVIQVPHLGSDPLLAELLVVRVRGHSCSWHASWFLSRF